MVTHQYAVEELVHTKAQDTHHQVDDVVHEPKVGQHLPRLLGERALVPHHTYQIYTFIYHLHKKNLFYHCVALCSRILATILNLFKFGRKKKSLSALEIGIISLVLTLNAPNNHSVYSSPTEKINRKIVDIKKVRMAKGLTPTMVTKAKEPNMAVQIRPDSLGSSSVTANSQSSGHNVWLIIHINNFLIKGKHLCHTRLQNIIQFCFLIYHVCL